MQTQFKYEIREIPGNDNARFDLLKSNTTFRNATGIVYPFSVTSYDIFVYYAGVEYVDLRVSRTNEKSVDIFLLTPTNRFFPPTLSPGLPGQIGKDFSPIPIEIVVVNTSGSASSFFVAVTWEISPPRGSW